VLALLAIVLAACGNNGNNTATKPTPSATTLTSPLAGKRVLSISETPREIPAPGPNDLVNAVDMIHGAGARGHFESHTWKELETRKGTYDTRGLKSSLDYLGRRGFSAMELNIKLIDTASVQMPDDLAGQPFDSAETKSRFHALIDTIKPALGGHVTYLSIGNEVDIYLNGHPSDWPRYIAFYQDAVRYVHSVLPGVKVGVTTTYDGARGTAQRVAQLNASSDVVILTYYPLGIAYRPRPASTAAGDIAKMLSIAGSKPLVLQEVGYPTGSPLGSSEASQAAFFQGVFATWKAAGARIPFVNIFSLHDLAPATCKTLAAYYGRPDDTNLQSYLCSLGLRRANGSAKTSWQAVVNSIKSTGVA
jgi:hypothetical protein